MSTAPPLPRLSYKPSSSGLPPPRAVDRHLTHSLQLSRASTMALTRLQLALTTGDRRQALAAMDRLHALDAEMESLVDRLPAPDEEDPEWEAMTRHLGDQKLALAFEKLALASGVSGPDMVSPGAGTVPEADTWPGEKPLPAEADAAAADAEWPLLPAVEPVEWKPFPARLLGLIAAVLAMIAVVAAVLAMTGG